MMSVKGSPCISRPTPGRPSLKFDFRPSALSDPELKQKGQHYPSLKMHDARPLGQAKQSSERKNSIFEVLHL